jgi:F-type H+-transporting ATPase subunit a
MHLSPDSTIFWQHGFFDLNITVVTTWGIMFVLTLSAWLITRKLPSDFKIKRWQGVLEIIVTGIQSQLQEVGLEHPEKYMGFIGTLFLFVAASSLFTLIPYYIPPTASLSTTTALALCVFISVPIFGIQQQGIGGYLKSYLIITELSRTLALAVRLFGNMMSGAMIIGILLSITPFVFPIVMRLLGLLTGMVQAYIFSILATVYIAAATREDKIDENIPKLKTT